MALAAASAMESQFESMRISTDDETNETKQNLIYQPGESGYFVTATDENATKYESNGATVEC